MTIKSICLYLDGGNHTIAISYSFLKNAPKIVLQNGAVRHMIKANKKNVLELIARNEDTDAAANFLSLYKNVKLEELNKYIDIVSRSVAVKAFFMDYKEKVYPSEKQEQLATEAIEKELGLREMTLEDWKKIYTFWPFAYHRKKGLVITSYKGTDTAITIPADVGGEAVLAIGPDAFSPKKKVAHSAKEIRNRLEFVTLSEGIVSICGDKWYAGAFSHCKSLVEVNLPDTLNEIGMYAFSGCEKIFEIMIPFNVKIIGEQAFSNCTNLKKITIPIKVKKIGKQAFWNCDDLVIHAPAGSYAEKYAKENNIPFVAE